MSGERGVSHVSSNQPPRTVILPSLIGGAIVAPAVSWVLASYSPDFKNNLTRFGFALPERVTEGGLAMGSSPSVHLAGTALITWAGLITVIVGAVYIIAAMNYEEFGEELNLEEPADSSASQMQQPQQGYPGQMPGMGMGMAPGMMPQQGYPGQMMPGMPGQMHMSQIPQHMSGPMQ